MRHFLVYSVLFFSLTLSACSERREEPAATATGAPAAREAADRDQVEITGCLTTNPQTNQVVLTAKSNPLSSITSRAAAGENESYHYVLAGGDNLQAMIGKEVRVRGNLVGRGDDVNVKSSAPATAVGTTASGDTATVKTTETVELQVQQLNVASVTATGAPCSAQ